MDRQTAGFGLTLVATGSVLGGTAALMATGRIPDAIGHSYWGVLAVVGLLHVFLGLFGLLFVASSRSEAAAVVVGVPLLRTSGIALVAATFQLVLFTLFALRSWFPEPTTALPWIGEPFIYAGLTTFVAFFTSLAMTGLYWSRGRGTVGRKRLAATKHGLAFVLALVPWFVPFGFIG